MVSTGTGGARRNRDAQQRALVEFRKLHNSTPVGLGNRIKRRK